MNLMSSVLFLIIIGKVDFAFGVSRRIKGMHYDIRARTIESLDLYVKWAVTAAIWYVPIENMEKLKTVQKPERTKNGQIGVSGSPTTKKIPKVQFTGVKGLSDFTNAVFKPKNILKSIKILGMTKMRDLKKVQLDALVGYRYLEEFILENSPKITELVLPEMVGKRRRVYKLKGNQNLANVSGDTSSFFNVLHISSNLNSPLQKLTIDSIEAEDQAEFHVSTNARSVSVKAPKVPPQKTLKEMKIAYTGKQEYKLGIHAKGAHVLIFVRVDV